MMGMLFRQRAAFLLGVTGALFCSRASGADDKVECLRAFESAQRARLKSDLVRAKAELKICSRDVCPALAQGPCSDWLREVESAVPSVVVSVRSAEGEDLQSARVTIDGEPQRVTGTSVELSPGEHRVVADGGALGRVERKIVVNVGEKNRVVVLTLTPPREKKRQAPAAAATSGAPSWPYWVGALGVVAVGAGVTLDLLASRRLDDLRSDCAPRCSESSVTSTRTQMIVGDSLALGGVIALGVATYGFLSGSSEAPENHARH